MKMRAYRKRTSLLENLTTQLSKLLFAIGCGRRFPFQNHLDALCSSVRGRRQCWSKYDMLPKKIEKRQQNRNKNNKDRGCTSLFAVVTTLAKGSNRLVSPTIRNQMKRTAMIVDAGMRKHNLCPALLLL
jgi:hypothetical protein